MKLAKTALAVVTAAAMAAITAPAFAAEGSQSDHRLVVYYQTQYHGEEQDYVSPIPLVDNGATDVMVAAIHLNGEDAEDIVTLNDHAPDHPRYDRMWDDLEVVQERGANLLGMVGGAAPGTFERLDNQFDLYYPLLRDLIETYGLDGVDLDVEEEMSLEGIIRVIDALRADFGPDFIITLAPVAPALRGGGNLSGFDYDRLYEQRGDDIAWFNAQFYCGWGLLDSPADYDQVIDYGVVPPHKVVAGTLTNPDNCGTGYVDMPTLRSTIAQLKESYPDFGGVMGWEYFNSLPGGTDEPWHWAAEVSEELNN